MIRHFTLAVAAVLGLTLPALAGEIIVTDAYARSATPTAPTGAAFLVIENHSMQDDRLIGVASEAAKRVQLHTHSEDAQGVLKMHHVEDGFALPAHGMIIMQRGGNHVMFMGLNAPFEQGKTVPLTLIFEQAGEMQINIPVDMERKAEHGHSEGHGHGHSQSTD